MGNTVTKIDEIIWIHKLGLTLRMLKDLKISQVWARVFLFSKRIIRKYTGAKVRHLTINMKPAALDLDLPQNEPGTIIKRANLILSGEFQFLNQTIRFHDKIDWRCSQASHLWRFNLHYMAGARDLADAFEITGDTVYLESLKKMIRSWIDDNSVKTGDGWHPYTVSL
ncbi:MAG: hypothetical protein ACM3YE_02970, partial [Bacteroidota bacterium]